MKIEEAIRYFEQELEGTEETEAWLAAQEIDDGVLAACAAEREALRLALKALREKQASERRSEEETNEQQKV